MLVLKRSSWIVAVSLLLASLAACEERPLDVTPQSSSIAWTLIDRFENSPSLTSVWGSSANDVWIGGERLLRRFDGAAWGDAPGGLDLGYTRAVWGTGPTNVYVVSGGLYRFDGSAWTREPIGAVLVGGRAENDVYAVNPEFVYHFDGSAWSTLYQFIDSQEPVGIWVGPSPQLAVLRRGSIVAWDGSTWRYIDVDWRPQDAWGTALDDLYIVGYASGSGNAWHYDGRILRPVDTPAGVYRLNGIWGSSPDDIYAVGDGGAILHWDGTAWARIEPVTVHSLHDVWGSGPGDVYVVGDQERILHFDGSTWRSIGSERPVRSYSFRAWAESPSRMFVTTSSGGTYRYVDGRWEEIPLVESGYVGALGGTSIDDVYASLESFAPSPIYHFDGTSWSLSADSLASIRDFWFSSKTDGYAVGGQSVYHFNGSSWQLVFEGGSSLYAVWGTSSRHVAAVGASGVVVECDGTTWKETRRLAGHPWDAWVDVWGTFPDNLWTAGYSGVFRYDGRRWENVTPLGKGDARFVTGMASGEVLAVVEGLFYLHDGAYWRRVDTPGYVQVYQAMDGSLILVDSDGRLYFGR